MFRTSRISHVGPTLVLVAVLLLSGVYLPQTAPPAFSQGNQLSLSVKGPSYVTPGSNITYTLTLKNLTSQQLTNIRVFSRLPANTTYVSGGTFVPVDNEAAFAVANLAANASQALTLVVNVGSGVALGTFIDSNYTYIYDVNGQVINIFGDDIRTTVEAPGTLTAVYKNASGRAFDLALDSYKFQNYGDDPPRVATDDLGADDLFLLFGPKVCHSGTTAATCVLTGPAREWMNYYIQDMKLGHCDGLAATSLRLFERLPFKGRSSPATFQSGAVNTADLNFPAQAIENYIDYYFLTQITDEVYNKQIIAGPNAIIARLTEDFNRTPPIPYTLFLSKVPGFKDGHSIAAYGVERVSANESRILVYDNNYPQQRQYITVNTAANTWSYTTAATPGFPPDVYTGTATSGNLGISSVRNRDLPAGQYFTCDFCSTAPAASAQAAAPSQLASKVTFQYAGEGALLVVNDEGQRTGADYQGAGFLEEIPGAEVIHHVGGLGKEVPPKIIVPVAESDETRYSAYVHGETVDSVTDGTLTIVGKGFTIGVRDIKLDPNNLFEFSVSPDGDHISFFATETVQAPAIFIAHDPIHDGDPSVIFEVAGETLFANEKVSLDLDPALERFHFDDEGAEAEQFNVTMDLIWPDGDTHVYTESINIPAGATSAFIDFGAWDSLLHPATYIDNVLQNPSVNHRLKLASSSGSYDSTPRPNAPAGVYRVKGTFTNVTEVSLENVYFSVANLGAGNVVLNAEGGAAGVGGKIRIPANLLGADGILHTNESFTYSFDVGLASKTLSNLTLDANGTPHDWIHPNPAPSYDANDASFAFSVRSSNLVYLPVVSR